MSHPCKYCLVPPHPLKRLFSTPSTLERKEYSVTSFLFILRGLTSGDERWPTSGQRRNVFLRAGTFIPLSAHFTSSCRSIRNPGYFIIDISKASIALRVARPARGTSIRICSPARTLSYICRQPLTHLRKNWSSILRKDYYWKPDTGLCLVNRMLAVRDETAPIKAAVARQS